MLRLLVANRGEIACRVFATCRAMGIETVAVFSDADADAPHARQADLGVRLPGRAARDTYLRGDLIVDAARRSGADAVHPGYGFLSENAEFAAAVIDAGLTWVGPPPKAIAAMGSKIEAKALLAEAGVPMFPSWTSPAAVTEFPVIVKASAGGGGRGMRVVRSAEELDEAIEAARREALAAFGDGTVFCERYVETGRHVEVQVIADAHGTTVALGERECSIQRRHQKIVEESPSPAVDDPLRTRLGEAAVAAARAVGYVGAGTVEFLLAPDGSFYFLEMNTRLQVEHPVTELVTGLDLVRLQLDVAAGRALPFTEAPPARGHAIEVRLYAEDPAHEWRPSTGRLHRFEIDGDVRLDAGVESGTDVTVHYDPMLAKVIVHAPHRDEAARRLARALAGARLHGVTTNRDLLVRILREPSFLAGETDTAYLDRHRDVFEPLLPVADRPLVGLAAALAAAAARRRDAVWAALPGGWRNVPSATATVSYEAPWGRLDVNYSAPVARVVSASPSEIVFDVDGVTRRFTVDIVDDMTFVDGLSGSVALTEVPRFPRSTVEREPGSLTAPMPATVGRVSVQKGQRVAAGDLLLTLEAMKLEHPVRAPQAGIVSSLPVESGTQVEAGAVLAVITTAAVITTDAVITPEDVP